MRIFISILHWTVSIVIIITLLYQNNLNQSVLKFMGMYAGDNLKNTVKLEGKSYVLYGLSGAGFIDKDPKYPVYHAVYIPEDDLDTLIDEARISATVGWESEK